MRRQTRGYMHGFETAASAATLGRKSLLLPHDSLAAQWQVDGVIVSASDAQAIAPERRLYRTANAAFKLRASRSQQVH